MRVVAPIFKKGNLTVLQLPGYQITQLPQESFFQGGGEKPLLNLIFGLSNVDSLLALRQLTSTLPLYGCWGCHVSREHGEGL